LHPFKYCGIFGYREDEDTALMKVGARYYDPTIGRWIQKDPILDGFNWWLYCENDPVNKIDPSGKSWYGDLVLTGVGLWLIRWGWSFGNFLVIFAGVVLVFCGGWDAVNTVREYVAPVQPGTPTGENIRQHHDVINNPSWIDDSTKPLPWNYGGD
jgi:RHS repeat-associated protein